MKTKDATNQPLVISFKPQFLADFVSLNREWIEKYFVFEEMDRIQLENPFEAILNRGGEIFFILDQGVALGTMALIPHGPACYELAKMAVSPQARGKGFGDLLIRSGIEWAKGRGAQKITLLSNTVLEPAISLYRKHGFKVVHLGKHPAYERCNIEMELVLDSITSLKNHRNASHANHHENKCHSDAQAQANVSRSKEAPPKTADQIHDRVE